MQTYLRHTHSVSYFADPPLFSSTHSVDNLLEFRGGDGGEAILETGPSIRDHSQGKIWLQSYIQARC